MINKIALKLGMVVTRYDTVRADITIDSYEDAIWNNKLQPLFNIDASIATDFFGFHFLKDNPYTKALLEYESDNKVDYASSELFRYYDSFQPESADDIIKDTALKHSEGLFCYTLPWDHSPKKNGGNRLMYSGPIDDDRGEKEYRRLIEVFDSIKKKGFVTQKSANLFNSNQIQGYFLECGGLYRFVVLHGKHRAAALCALNRNRIPVTFELNKPRVVRRTDVDKWPQVRNGNVSKEDALRAFDKIFEGINYG